MTNKILDSIIEAINLEKSKNPPCGTALVINDELWRRLNEDYPDLKDRLPDVDVLVDKAQEGFVVENWEWTQPLSEWQSGLEFIKAVYEAETTGKVDPRLKPIREAPPETWYDLTPYEQATVILWAYDNGIIDSLDLPEDE